MITILKKGYLIGLGLASLTREKVEEVVDELVRRGEVAEQDRPHIIQNLVSRMKEEQSKLTTSVRETVQKVIAETGVPTRKQYQELVERVEKLEQAAHSHKKATGGDSST